MVTSSKYTIVSKFSNTQKNVVWPVKKIRLYNTVLTLWYMPQWQSAWPAQDRPAHIPVTKPEPLPPASVGMLVKVPDMDLVSTLHWHKVRPWTTHTHVAQSESNTCSSFLKSNWSSHDREEIIGHLTDWLNKDWQTDVQTYWKVAHRGQKVSVVHRFTWFIGYRVWHWQS